MHCKNLATHDCVANLQECVAFSDATHGKLNPGFKVTLFSCKFGSDSTKMR